MATVPQTPATREPLPTLVAELYGDQATPAPQPPANDHTAGERWQDAVTHVGEQLRAKLRVDVLPERQHKALALVLAHAVTLHPDGTASVQSGQQTYTLAPECPCADATHRTALCKHSLAVELHRRALARLDETAAASGTAPSAPASAAVAQAGAAPRPSTDAPPATTADARQERLPSADRWDVTEAPASCCLRLRVGDLELLYTMRDVTDAELTSRVQHLLPWVQDLLDQARERHTLLDTLRQQREAAHAAPTAPPTPSATVPQADVQALIQQALAAQQATSTGQTPANGTAPEATTPTVPAGWCPVHQVAMEQRSNAKGTWWSHWLAGEQRYCKGKP